ncbi:putative carbohydrate esterase [Drosera capensis]
MGSTQSIPTPTPSPIPTATDIFILSGQSNMSGRGGVSPKTHTFDGEIPIECHPNPNILRLDAGLHWVPAHEPLHSDIDTRKTCGVGPGMAFANKLLGQAGEGTVIGLVPCAVGGTAMREWGKGEREGLYENMVRRAREGKRVVGGGEGVIRGVLWYQGESDTVREEDAKVYKGRMERLIEVLRSDLGLPELPFIQVAIASGDKKHIDEVRKVQLGINLPNVVCVDAKGLPLNTDHLHLTTEAQVKLGHMLADAYLKHFAAPLPTSS